VALVAAIQAIGQVTAAQDYQVQLPDKVLPEAAVAAVAIIQEYGGLADQEAEAMVAQAEISSPQEVL
jgi:hypothetical protein